MFPKKVRLSPKSCACERDLFFFSGVKVVKVGLNSNMTDVHIKEGNLDSDAERWPCEDRDRKWS